MKNCKTFYSYKNGKMYSTCIECFIKKGRCEFCNKEINKSYLRSHVKKQHYIQDDKRAASHNDEAQLRTRMKRSFAQLIIPGVTRFPRSTIK